MLNTTPARANSRPCQQCCDVRVRPPYAGTHTLPAQRDLRNVNTVHFRTVESKLGSDCHLWEALAVSDDPDVMREEHISTAFFSVVYPPPLDTALGDLADAPLSAGDTSRVVLDVFFELISQRFGRHAFKFWPAGSSSSTRFSC